MTVVFSNGGGKQSAGIAALIVQGRLPKPDYSVFADTGREKTRTLEYLRDVIHPALEAVGVTCVIASHDLATVDLYAHSGQLLIPAFTNRDGAGRLPSYCSNEWKRRVILRQLRELGVRSCEMWLGFSTDEFDRARPSGEKWVTHRFPLLDLGLAREDCARATSALGWPEPPKSSCWHCPHMGDGQWADLQANHPADFQKAVELDTLIRERDPNVFLHKSMTPLAMLDFDPGQESLFTGCDTGGCWL